MGTTFRGGIMRYRSSQKGFTLTELLVASMLISIVLSATYSLFSGSIRTWRFMEQEYNVDQRMRNVVTLFSREVESLLPSTFYLFEGTDTEITLYTLGESMNLELGEGQRLLQVRYRFDSQQKRLVREEGIIDADLPPIPMADQELDRSRIKVDDESEYVVANHVEDFSIRYVWMPFPPLRDPLIQPEMIQPVYLPLNRERWGYPQALELNISLRDQEGKLRTTKSTIPLRMTTTYLRPEELQLRLLEMEEAS